MSMRYIKSLIFIILLLININAIAANGVLSGPTSAPVNTVLSYAGPKLLQSTPVTMDAAGTITTPASINATNLFNLLYYPFGNVVFYAITNNIGFTGNIFFSNNPTMYINTTMTATTVNGTNFPIDFSIPETDYTPTTNINFIYSTNYNTSGGQSVFFALKGSANNYYVTFGSDLTNKYGLYTTNGYILSNSNAPHLFMFEIRGTPGSEIFYIIPPKN